MDDIINEVFKLPERVQDGERRVVQDQARRIRPLQVQNRVQGGERVQQEERRRPQVEEGRQQEIEDGRRQIELDHLIDEVFKLPVVNPIIPVSTSAADQLEKSSPPSRQNNLFIGGARTVNLRPERIRPEEGPAVQEPIVRLDQDHRVQDEKRLQQQIEESRLQETEEKRQQEAELRELQLLEERIQLVEERIREVERKRLQEIENKRLQEIEDKRIQEIEDRIQEVERRRLQQIENRRLQQAETRRLESLEDRRVQQEELRRVQQLEDDRLVQQTQLNTLLDEEVRRLRQKEGNQQVFLQDPSFRQSQDPSSRQSQDPSFRQSQDPSFSRTQDFVNPFQETDSTARQQVLLCLGQFKICSLRLNNLVTRTTKKLVFHRKLIKLLIFR